MHCKQCNTTKDADEFYKGNKSRCKECIKASATAYRLANLERVRAYDRQRGSNPQRVAARASYAQTEGGKAAHERARQRYLATNPNAHEAHRRYAKSERGKAKKREWQSSEAGKLAARRNTTSQRALRPDRSKARITLGNAVRDGRVIPWPVCAVPECCGRPHGHHPDYSRPLDVVWLCDKHHKEVHAMARQAA
ncbi:hypothetical protein [Paracidovorax wautersii]|uniref:Bacteriophage Lambda NinG protein n=1 Tax=Paracidovorax wautersii TaxID=1177982 RepID=A0ABU1IG79_9BURK|nr:hypothetical protein [Paracidovorax wautersii]MDR6216225.1 hypothetical protein [Paracidovorax wautersii]